MKEGRLPRDHRMNVFLCTYLATYYVFLLVELSTMSSQDSADGPLHMLHVGLSTSCCSDSSASATRISSPPRP